LFQSGALLSSTSSFKAAGIPSIAHGSRHTNNKWGYKKMDYLMAFLVAAFICVVAQIIMDTRKLQAGRDTRGYISLQALFFRRSAFTITWSRSAEAARDRTLMRTSVMRS
jgi:hypothetical protein